MNKQEISQSLSDKLALNKDSNVTIVGLGETGFSVATFLHQYDISFTVTDSRNEPPFSTTLQQQLPNTPIFLGGFHPAAFDGATHLVVSPGISLQQDFIQNIIQSGAKIISDIDLFACSTTQPIIAITGSNGKSTVTTMLGIMGNAANVKTAIGGNLGPTALDLLSPDIQLYVLELSSFQLERTSVLNATVATVLNISADHLDRHHDLATYTLEKQKVFSGHGAMVLNADDSLVNAMKEHERESLSFSVTQKADFHLSIYQDKEWLMHKGQPLIKRSQLPFEGRHNTANALAALALGSTVNLDMQSMVEALPHFCGLEHRMQKIAEIDKVSWINDSKATNIGACIAALEGYQNKVILIAGGDAKGANINDLIPTILKKVKYIILLGKDAKRIDTAINQRIPSHHATNMKKAVQIAATLAQTGEHVLLSPACASLDQYKNYQERGAMFHKAVLELTA